MSNSFRGVPESPQVIPHRDLTQSVLFGDIKVKRGIDYNNSTGEITVKPRGNSEYIAMVSITLNSIPVGLCRLLLYVNGAEVHRSQKNFTSAISQPETLQMSRLLYLANGDDIEVKIWNDAATPQTVSIFNAPNTSSIDLIKVGS